jgi:hypothetical protein
MTGAEIVQPCSGEGYQSWGLLETPHRLLNLSSPCPLVYGGGRSWSALVTYLDGRVSAARWYQAIVLRYHVSVHIARW